MLTRRTILAASGLLLTPGWLLAQEEKRKNTVSNIEGPFYRKGAPFRGTIAVGLPFSLPGRVDGDRVAAQVGRGGDPLEVVLDRAPARRVAGR